METMRAQTNAELQDMIGRMFEADHPVLSIVAMEVAGSARWD